MFPLPLHISRHGSPPAQQSGAASFNTDLPPRPSPGTAEALPLPEPRRWLPYNRSLLQALIFLQTCTFSAFAAPSCGDSASVQTRGQLEAGRDGIPPPPLPPARRGDRQLQAGGSEAPGRAAGTDHVPGSERGCVRRRCQKHHGHWHSPDRTGDCGGSGTPGTAALLCSVYNQPPCLSITY